MARKAASVKWTEPWAISRRRAPDELRAAGVTWKMWVRSAFLSAIVVLLLIAAMLIWAPGVVIPWRQVIIGLAVMPIILFVNATLHVLAPVIVIVSEDVIHLVHGQSGATIQSKRILALTVDDTAEPPRLRIVYTKPNGTRKERWVALSPKVDRARLDSLMEKLLAGARKVV